MTRKRIYVAGPYSCEGRCEPLGVDLDRMRKGIEAAVGLLHLGYAPFCPWLDFMFQFVSGGRFLERKDYYDYSMAWLEASDAVYCIELRLNSHGTLAEIARAKELNIPVFHNIHELVEAMK